MILYNTVLIIIADASGMTLVSFSYLASEPAKFQLDKVSVAHRLLI